MDHAQVVPPQMQRAMSQVSSSHYATPYESPELLRFQTAPAPSRKRSHQEDYNYDFHGLQGQQALVRTTSQVPVELTPYSHHPQLPLDASPFYLPSQRASSRQSHTQQPTEPYQPQTHHHHRLPNKPPPAKSQRTGYDAVSAAAEDQGPPSVVGQPGMPEPAPKPKGPKLKFTADEDALLVELKETKDLTWKQIADFFPGRTSGTLQVRYCTKLKAKVAVWTDEMAQKLRTALEEYDNDRWRIISGKVGCGFSAAACRDKAEELDTVNLDTTAPTEATRETATRQHL
ncbi:hypothetical protein LTR08_002714 [Meristemomyces frigidus]|nr:hypothetical protein LTR08_002714 [Meristemomyces frigidus]